MGKEIKRKKKRVKTIVTTADLAPWWALLCFPKRWKLFFFCNNRNITSAGKVDTWIKSSEKFNKIYSVSAPFATVCFSLKMWKPHVHAVQFLGKQMVKQVRKKWASYEIQKADKICILSDFSYLDLHRLTTAA